MKLNYRDFHYRPDYGYELIENGKRLTKIDKVGGAVCFSSVFGCFYMKSNVIFEGNYTLRCRKNFEEYSGNYCSMDKKQINKILRYMRSTFEIDITMTETETNYVFDFSIIGKPIKHKFILTFCRVFFEYPYNEIAKDVLRIRDKGIIDGVDFTHKSFLSLYNCLWGTYLGHYGCGHSLFLYPTQEVKIQTLKTAFEEGRSKVHDVYPGDSKLYKKMSIRTASMDYIDWDDDFEHRLQLYSKNFKLLKEIKNEKGVRRRARKAVQ